MAARNAHTKLLPYALLGGLVAGGIWYMRNHHLVDIFHNVRADIAELKLRLTGFHIESDGQLTATIEALNPTSEALHVQSIVGNFIIAGRQAGAVKMFGDTVIRANDQGLVPVNVRILPAAVNLFRNKGHEVAFKGTININNNLLPLTMTYRL